MDSDIRRKVTPRSIAAMEGLEEEPEKSELEEERTLREERTDATDSDAFQSVTMDSEGVEVILRVPLPDIPFPDVLFDIPFIVPFNAEVDARSDALSVLLTSMGSVAEGMYSITAPSTQLGHRTVRFRIFSNSILATPHP